VTGKTKIIVFCLLGLFAAALFIYGVGFHSTNVLAQKDDSAALTKSEPALIKEVSIGGVERDTSGRLRQTYTGEVPKACPT